MKIGLNSEQPFDEWARGFEKNIACTVVELFHASIGLNDTVGQMLHETTSFILKEAGISPAILQVFEFISADDKPGKECDDHASKEL